ncbi:AraC-like ligand-binding domain-containing protein [Nocardiopsis potens]|uniref:AraC-like ligand-binding domain-containing protein n=1 Tax=Nocardiopsis potens TaxID=1246458 RepID=UPI000344BDA7|nr:hypothetical protein [Nocardiopsis potens]
MATTVRSGRSDAHRGDGGAAPYLVFINRSGWLRLEQNGMRVQGSPEQACLATAAQPFSVELAEATRPLVVFLPYDRVAARIGAHARMPALLDLSSGLGAVVGTVAEALIEQCSEVTAGEFDAVVRHIAEITCLSLGGGSGRRYPAGERGAPPGAGAPRLPSAPRPGRPSPPAPTA